MMNKDSLMARINTLSAHLDVHANILLRKYFFDSFLKRIALSEYSDILIFKGGFLLENRLGLGNRTTADIDFLLKNAKLEKENIGSLIKKITDFPVNDGICFDILRISEIRKDDKYGGFSISLAGRLSNLYVPVNIDIATGDPVTPCPVIIDYESIITNEKFRLWGYNYETILAEKLQTVLYRHTLNSRMKDFYDIYIISKLCSENLSTEILRTAFRKTCTYRKTMFSEEDIKMIFSDLQCSSIMLERWNRYARKNEFAKEICYPEILKSLSEVLNVITDKDSKK